MIVNSLLILVDFTMYVVNANEKGFQNPISISPPFQWIHNTKTQKRETCKKSIYLSVFTMYNVGIHTRCLTKICYR